MFPFSDFFMLFGGRTVWCNLYYKLLFLMRLSDAVSFSVYMNIFQTYLCYTCGKMTQKCEQFSHELFFCDFGRFVVLNAPHHSPTPSPASMSKFPPGEKILKKNVFVCDLFVIFVNKIEKMVLK